MIDLTPLDVRKKSGDFKKLMRGYDPQEVDVFLELVAERLEGLVRENMLLKERAEALQQQVSSQLGREQAVQDALVTAQTLRADIQAQSEREAEHVLREAETEARRLIAEAEAQARGRLRATERKIEGASDALVELERRRSRFLAEFRHLLERELDVVQVEDGRAPLEVRAIDLDLGAPADAPAAARPASPAASVGSETDSGPVEQDADPAVEVAATASASEADSPVDPGDGESAAPEALGSEDPTELVTSVDSLAPTPIETSGPVEPVEAAPEAPAAASPAPIAPPRVESRPAEELELPTFVRPQTPEGPGPVQPDPTGLSTSMAAEALAAGEGRTVDLTRAPDRIEVPSLEEVLAEAGADLIPTDRERPPTRPETSAPGAPADDETLSLYLDPEDPETR